MIITRKIQNIIEKKGHGFIVNVLTNKEYYRFCQPCFLYSYLKFAMTGMKDDRGVCVLGGKCPGGECPEGK